MTREEINAKLEEVFYNALNGDGNNYPVQLKLKSGVVINGFKILENSVNSILGFTTDQRMDSVRDLEMFQATVVRKKYVTKIICPELDYAGPNE